MTTKRTLDLSLYLVVGPHDVAGRSLLDVVRNAVAGGVSIVQLRRKDDAMRLFTEDARALVALLRPLGVPLIVNDNVDVAIAAHADGVHLGQSDQSPAQARRLLGLDAIIGLSVSSANEARLLDPSLVDYAGIGPVFSTATKPDAGRPLGLHETRDICALLSVPAVAIGGVSHANAADVWTTGVRGIAVVSAICAAADPRAAAVQFTTVAKRLTQCS